MLKHLTDLRKKQNWSLQETADKLGIAKSTYAGYESGYRTPSLLSLAQIADLFNTTVDFLIGRTEHELNTIEITQLINNHELNITLDGTPLSAEEIVDFTAFVRTKRTLKDAD